MAEINSNNWDVICRTCLCDQAEHSILSLRLINDKRLTIKDILLTLTELEVIYPGLPNNICTKCIQQLEAAYSFSENCVRVEKILIGASKKLKAQLPKAETSLYEHSYYGVPSGSQQQSYGYLEQLLRHTVSSEGNYGDNLADDFIEMDDRGNGMKGEVAVQANKLLAQPSHQNQLQPLHPPSHNNQLQTHLSQLQNQPPPLRNHPPPLQNHPPQLQNHPSPMQSHTPQLQTHQSQMHNHQSHGQVHTQLGHQPVPSHRIENLPSLSQMLPSHQLQPQRQQISSHSQISECEMKINVVNISALKQKAHIVLPVNKNITLENLKMLDNPDYISEVPKTIKCSVCEKYFSCAKNAKKHERKMHDLHKVAMPRKKPTPETETRCHHCNKGFLTKGGLLRHEKFIHGIDIRTKKPTLRCSECEQWFDRRSSFEAHLAIRHPEINLDFEEFYFETEQEFIDWKIKMERDTRTQYTIKMNYTSAKNIKRSYHCHRSGSQNSFPSHIAKRNERMGGSCKSGYYCPSRILCMVSNSSDEKTHLEVTFCSTHLGHGFELYHLKPSMISTPCS